MVNISPEARSETKVIVAWCYLYEIQQYQNFSFRLAYFDFSQHKMDTAGSSRGNVQGMILPDKSSKLFENTTFNTYLRS